MTKKNYIAAAKLLAVYPNSKEKNLRIELFCELFAADNARFKADTFRAACNKE